MRGFSSNRRDFLEYILGITKEIWENRGIGSKIRVYYGKDVIVRMPRAYRRG